MLVKTKCKNGIIIGFKVTIQLYIYKSVQVIGLGKYRYCRSFWLSESKLIYYSDCDLILNPNEISNGLGILGSEDGSFKRNKYLDVSTSYRFCSLNIFT